MGGLAALFRATVTENLILHKCSQPLLLLMPIVLCIQHLHACFHQPLHKVFKSIMAVEAFYFPRSHSTHQRNTIRNLRPKISFTLYIFRFCTSFYAGFQLSLTLAPLDSRSVFAGFPLKLHSVPIRSPPDLHSASTGFPLGLGRLRSQSTWCFISVSERPQVSSHFAFLCPFWTVPAIAARSPPGPCLVPVRSPSGLRSVHTRSPSGSRQEHSAPGFYGRPFHIHAWSTGHL